MEFGRLQARDLLQHLWTGPISNSPVDIVQGSKSVEVRPVGISKVRAELQPAELSIDQTEDVRNTYFLYVLQHSTLRQHLVWAASFLTPSASDTLYRW